MIRPSAEEKRDNPRSSSAKLRFAVRRIARCYRQIGKPGMTPKQAIVAIAFRTDVLRHEFLGPLALDVHRVDISFRVQREAMRPIQIARPAPCRLRLAEQTRVESPEVLNFMKS